MRIIVVVSFLMISCAGPTRNDSETYIESLSARFLQSVDASDSITGKKMGSVIIGSTGFDAFQIEIDSIGNWKLINSRFNPSRVHEDEVTLEMVTSGLTEYFNEMVEDGILEDDIYLLISSSASQNPRLTGITAVLERIGMNVTSINSFDEGKYGYLALMIPELNDSSYVVDLGSGNTKVSWIENGEIRSMETYGSKYHQLKTPDQLVFNEMENIIKMIPEPNRKYCLIIGGVPFRLAKDLEKHLGRYTFLKQPEFYEPGDDETLKSGLNIYRSIYQTSGTRCFVFDWNSNFSIGYLIEQNNQEIANRTAIGRNFQ